MRIGRQLRLAMGALCWVAGLSFVHGQLLITEFLAANQSTLADEDGDYSDWVEIYNPSADSVNLAGWYLTDSSTNLTRWRFPDRILEPNSYLVVFASGKDRDGVGSELHASFALSSAGEYLALVKPDGQTVASSFRPAFPVQVPDVSFGVAMRQSTVPLLSSDASAKWFVPQDDRLGQLWNDPDWDDSGWSRATTGVGFAGRDQSPEVAVLADSLADFSGIQGRYHWLYGYYNKTADRVSGYHLADFTPFPGGLGSNSASNFWTGTSWDWLNGDPPWTEIGPSYTHPNGVNSGAEHWAIRRWISPITGNVTIRWHAAKQTPFGSGVTLRVLHQAVQKDIALINGNDLTGLTRTLSLTNVQTGDFIDFALAPTGFAGATDDRSDGTVLTVTIEAATTLASLCQTSLESAMRQTNASLYLRIPFVVNDPSAFGFLTLRMKYDDGFVAYLNGVEVARAQAPETPAWNSTALAPRSPGAAFQFEDFDLSSQLGLLHVGTNLLAIHGLNARADDADFLLLPELAATRSEIDPAAARYFPRPSPGAPNDPGRTNLGPLILEARHTPWVPRESESLVVTARASPAFAPVTNLTLVYRVMFGLDLKLEMKDDGLHGDGAAGDGVYGATIPAGTAKAGQMVRYYVTAEDAKSQSSRWPLYPDPKNSPQYAGTVVADPSLTNALPVFHWFVSNPTAADTTTGTRCSVFYEGEFYDNVAVNLHGQSSTQFPKKSYDLDFNRGSHFRYDPQQRRLDHFNLLTTYPDKAHMRNLLAYETYRDAGSPYHIAFAVRLQRNGLFFSDAHFVEDGDDIFLERLGLDPNGALYKMYNTLNSSTSGAEKKTRKKESNADLQALIDGLRRTGAARTQYLFDNINIPAMVNYLAAMIITGGVDCCHKNYYAYRDTEGTGEWQYLPWDVDLTFGRDWNSAQTYYDDTIHATNPLYIGSNNALISALFALPSFRQMYLRRVRTLMDDLLQPAATPLAERKYERRVDELAGLIGPDAALDYAKWPTWGQKQTLTQAVNLLKTLYFQPRRTYLYSLRDIPTAQPTNAVIAFGGLDFNPASGNQAEEFVLLTNRNSFAVDLSGWKLAGPIEHTFAPGTVLPTTGSIYVSPDVVAFRARSSGPRGGQSLLVQGNYRNQLPVRGATLRLLDAGQRQVGSFAYAGQPSPAQQHLRVTEIMYHPLPASPGSPFPAADFEFLELKNTGPAALDLARVRFTNGIYFTFASSAASLLPPGCSVFLAKNPTAFIARYGYGFNLAGPYVGSLNNGGEKLRLDDAVGETILEFAYNNAWYPATDGAGFSLVIGDEKGPWDTWGEKSRWRQGSVVNGSPARPALDLVAWRAQHFTLVELGNPAISGDEADPDQDLFTNRQEFLSGTNPREGQSALRIESVALGQGSVPVMRIRFQAVADKSYSLQTAEALTGASWRKLADVPRQPFARAVEITDPTVSQKNERYYRLITPVQPERGIP